MFRPALDSARKVLTASGDHTGFSIHAVSESETASCAAIPGPSHVGRSNAPLQNLVRILLGRTRNHHNPDAAPQLSRDGQTTRARHSSHDEVLLPPLGAATGWNSIPQGSRHTIRDASNLGMTCSSRLTPHGTRVRHHPARGASEPLRSCSPLASISVH